MNSRQRRRLEAEKHNRLLAKNKAERIERADRTVTKKTTNKTLPLLLAMSTVMKVGDPNEH